MPAPVNFFCFAPFKDGVTLKVDEGMEIWVLLQYFGDKLTARAEDHFVSLQLSIAVTGQGDIGEVLVCVEIFKSFPSC